MRFYPATRSNLIGRGECIAPCLGWSVVLMRVGRKAALFIAEKLGELFAQLESGAEEPDFDVGLAQTERVGCLADGQAFDITQEEHQPVLFVELRQGVVDQASGLVPFDQSFG